MISFFLSLLLATSFPSSSKTSWMSPQSFRLQIGMKRVDAVGALDQSGWEVMRGRTDDELVVDYTGEKALTLEFRKDRLHSIRFELFGMIPDVRAAFEEQRTFLLKAHGEPKKTARNKTVVVYDDRLPNIIVVLSDDPKTEYGKKGVGYLAVRYYDPR
ncbi:MAG TPA: hypothetical protein VF057_04575 [Thermoanaerobaculia bacterium]